MNRTVHVLAYALCMLLESPLECTPENSDHIELPDLHDDPRGGYRVAAMTHFVAADMPTDP